MVPLIQRAQQRHFQQHADYGRRQHCQQDPRHERPGDAGQRGRQVRADHIQRAMGQVDHVHDAEHQGQPSGKQEQHQAELDAVQRLLENEDGHARGRGYFILHDAA